ncbi:MAG: hypothetical protein WA441_02595 [Methyloceanibacter sp.]
MSTSTPPSKAPPGWGTDELTKFLDSAHSNQWATFWNKRGATEKLIAIDAQFVNVSKDWLDPESHIEWGGAVLMVVENASARLLQPLPLPSS